MTLVILKNNLKRAIIMANVAHNCEESN